MASKKRPIHTRTPEHPPCVLIDLGWESVELIRGILEFAREHGLAVIHPRNPRDRPDNFELVDGVIGAFADTPELAKRLNSCGRPVVDLANANPHLQAARVLPDNREIGILAAEHFRRRGLKRVIGFDISHGWASLERMEAFAGAAREAGLDCRMEVTDADGLSVENPTGALHQWARERILGIREPCGLFCANDDQARFAMNIACEAGIAIPDTLAILGVDNDPMVCEYTLVPLSSVDNDLFRIGYEGARLLAGLMAGETPPKAPLRIRPIGLATRRSSDLYCVENPHVRKVLELIRDNYHRRISTEILIEQIPLSRSLLYKHFKEQVGHSIGTEITRQRIKRAKQRLVESEEKLYSVGVACGFASLNSFCRTFKAETGLTPGEFRNQHL